MCPNESCKGRKRSQWQCMSLPEIVEPCSLRMPESTWCPISLRTKKHKKLVLNAAASHTPIRASQTWQLQNPLPRPTLLPSFSLELYIFDAPSFLGTMRQEQEIERERERQYLTSSLGPWIRLFVNSGSFREPQPFVVSQKYCHNNGRHSARSANRRDIACSKGEVYCGISLSSRLTSQEGTIAVKIITKTFKNTIQMH